METAGSNPGWGLRGRASYPTTLTLDSVQEARGSWELNLILDDGLVADCFTYDAGDGKRRLGKLVTLDPSRRLSGTTLYVPQGELELALRFFDGEQRPLEALDCILNFHDWSFHELPGIKKQALDIRGGGGHQKGLVEMGGARIRYAEKNYEDPVMAAQRIAEKPGMLSRGTGMLNELATLVMRTYLGAFFAYNFLKVRSIKGCLIAALLIGFCSGRTLGGSLGLLFGSGCAKAGLVFLPILAILYLALNPESYYEMVDSPGLFFGWSNWNYGAEEILSGTFYAAGGLALAWLLLHPFFATDDDGKKKSSS